MARTLMAIRRIQKLHAENNHERCSITTCQAARAEFEEMPAEEDTAYEHDRRLSIKALSDELNARGLNPRDYIAAEESDGVDALHEQPDEVHRIVARTEVKRLVDRNES